MMISRCSYETDVECAARTGNWTAELKTHVADCGRCGEIALVAGVLNREYRLAIMEGGAVEAGRIWWVAQLRARWMKTERATRPIVLVGAVGLSCAGLALAMVFVRVSEAVIPWMAWVPSIWDRPFEAAAATVAITGGALALLLPLLRFLLPGLEE